MNEVEINSKVTVTPKLMAEIFWGMYSTEQAEFFEELHNLTNKKESYGLGEMQWCYLSDELDKRPKAKAQACAMMVWIFNKATDFLSRQPVIPSYYDAVQ